MITTTTGINSASTHEQRFAESIRRHLQGIPQQSLSQFGKKLFPILSHSNIWASLYNCFHTFYSIRINKGEKFDDGTRMILKYAEDMKDQSIVLKMRGLLDDGEFVQQLEELIARELANRNPVNGGNNGNNNRSNNYMNNSQQQQNGTKTNTQSTVGKKNQQQKSVNNINNVVDISDDSPPAERQSNNHNINNKIQITSNGNNQHIDNHNNSNVISGVLSSDPYDVPNFSLRQVCLCGKSCQLMQPKKDFVFKCCHCNLHFHIECMQRGKANYSQTDPIKKLVSCAYCHLKQLCPMKQVMKTLFVGVLKQGRKRHEIIFNLDMMDLKTKKWRIQVRCFRLKQKIQTFVLFPDSASFSINNRFQKQFLPLPKQSSLKYRKDEPFLLTQHLINHQNKVTIIQRIPKKQSRDDRIQPQNHLFGIYLVQDKQVASIVKEIKLQNAFTFYQSKSMLDRCLRIGDAEDITCQVLKIPIICTLTIQRIRTPVRGNFCSHFQCFDLNNFLILTSTSTNPRWLCPLCKQPAYSFKYDVIIGSIIQEFSKQQPTQIMFTKDGEFKVYSNEKLCPGVYGNINDLPIDVKFKRQLENALSQQQVTRELQLISSDDVEQERKVEMDVMGTTNGNNNNVKISIQNSVVNGSNGDITNNNISVNIKQKNQQHQPQQQQKIAFEIPQNANIISLDDD